FALRTGSGHRNDLVDEHLDAVEDLVKGCIVEHVRRRGHDPVARVHMGLGSPGLDMPMPEFLDLARYLGSGAHAELETLAFEGQRQDGRRYANGADRLARLMHGHEGFPEVVAHGALGALSGERAEILGGT